MKNGLIFENGELIYYKDDSPCHAGVIEQDGDIYYIGAGGRAVKGEHAIHRTMANGILKRGTYKFGDDYKLVEGFYIAPEKRKSKKKKKKMRKTAIIVISSLLFVSMLLVSLFSFDLISWPGDNDGSDNDSNSNKISVFAFENEVLLCSESAKNFYDNKIDAVEAVKSGSPYRTFVFNYNINANRNGKLYLSENDAFLEYKEFVLPHDLSGINIDNLKTGTTYYYKAECEGETIFGSFRTAASVRYLSIPGVYNVRDIGGYTTADGKIVKQGLIIRGSEVDGLSETAFFLQDEDAQYMKSEFGFVCDFDLRDESIFTGKYISRLGADVKHKFYNAPFYGNIFNASNKQTLKNIFSDLADKSNYPMYMHCTYGADRTGVVVFLIQGLLGVSEEDMVKEFRQTGYFKNAYSYNSNMDIVLLALEGYEGENVNERIENFLKKDIGVTEDEIQSIRDILLED